ncbi:MAG TPA: chromosomal replication initiator protein DnaA [Verrucomicrobiae bacterium]|nr:chromosomal replication initiator protein DnaA [Verrucomicrobiae bacterium]
MKPFPWFPYLVDSLWKSCAPSVEKMNSWDQIRNYLQHRVSAEGYDNWLKGTAFLGQDGEILSVSVPDHDTRSWLESEYAQPIRDGIRDLKLPVRQILYETDLRQPMRAMSSIPESPVPELEMTGATLNPKFTFETFVVGACNQFAHAAAKSVATNPSHSYNPLFLYGGVGMGKTHLMHAIGRELINRFGTMKIIYTSSERFMNEMIACIRMDRMRQFHQRYREADVLLVDDIQMIGNKERTQEEFFHTFNELHDHQKQIVISSDAPPKDIPGLVERLRSRFEWGLQADIQPPDLETKMAILDKKAEAEGVKLPDEVRSFMASKTKSNVRELEGALVKLIAYTSLTGTPINLQMAQQVLKHLVHVQDRRVSIDSIQKAVAERFTIKQSQLKEKSNTKKIVYPRQIAMYLVKELTDASLPEIGRAFGGKHHTTVLHSINKIEKERHTDVELNRLLHSLMDSLQ